MSRAGSRDQVFACSDHDGDGDDEGHDGDDEDSTAGDSDEVVDQVCEVEPRAS